MAAAVAVTVAVVTSGGNADSSPTVPSSADSTGAPSLPPAGPEVASTMPDPGGPARTMEELEARWASARRQLVQRLSEPGLGVGADTILRGPGGFQIDLGSCPAGWSGTEGLDATTILIGHTTAQTGNLAASGRVTAGLQAYIDEVNATGGIDGRQIQLVTKDDGFVPTATVEAVAQLLDADKPFAITTLGSPTSLAVYDAINNACVPQPFVISSHPAWGDPLNHPWTIGLQLSPTTEAALWGAWIGQNLAADGPVPVSALVMDNELGRLYEHGFQAWADAHPEIVASFSAVHHDPIATSVSAELSTIAAGKPAAVLAMTAGRPCLQAIEDAPAAGLSPDTTALFLPSACQDPATFLQPAGAAAQGWRVLGSGLKSLTDPRWADDPYVGWARETMAGHGLDPADPQTAAGFALFGWAQVEVLRTASELPGGLTRPNLMLVLRGLDFQHPLSLDGIRLATSGNADPYPLEGSDVAIFDAATGAWRPEGALVDANGTTPPCPWDGTSC